MEQSMTIYKDKAIEAIWSEPNLLNKYWFAGETDAIRACNTWNVKTCAVCAVGSVLRSHCFTTKVDAYALNPILNGALRPFYTFYERDFLVNKTDYLANLSMAFEYWCAEGIEPNSKYMKQHLVDVISMHWPAKFEFTY